MSDNGARRLVSEALEYASVPGYASSEKKNRFLAGEDISLSDLEIDSLAAMELCIAIEANLDVSILPAELAELESLNALVERIGSLQDAR